MMLKAILTLALAASAPAAGAPTKRPAGKTFNDVTTPCGCKTVKYDYRVMYERAYEASKAHRARPDLAELLQKHATSPPRRRTRAELMKPVLKELNRSLLAHRPVSPEFEMQRALNGKYGDTSWVLVYEDRIYASDAFASVSKHRGHAIMMKQAQALVGLPNALYQLSTATYGSDGCEAEPLMLTINKEFGYDQCGVLIPNTYFGGHGDLWSWGSESIKAIHDRTPFQNRTGAALYRGTLSKFKFDDAKYCALNSFGNYARLAAFAASKRSPDRVDAVRPCRNGKPQNLDASCVAPEPQCEGLVDDFNSGLKAGSDIGGTWVDLREYRRRKYLLNLPGGASGSYSKNLNHIWRTEAVALQWVAPFVEWYFPALIEGTNYLKVAQHSVAETVEALEAHPAAAESIGLAGRRDVHDHFLCPACMAEYLQKTLEGFSAHLKLGSILDDPKRASKFFRDNLPCDRIHELDLRVPSWDTEEKGYGWSWKLKKDDPAHPCREGGPSPDRGAARHAREAAKRALHLQRKEMQFYESLASKPPHHAAKVMFEEMKKAVN